MEVKKYLKKEFESILTTELLREAVLGDLQYETQTERFKKIEEKLVKNREWRLTNSTASSILSFAGLQA